MIIIHNIYIYIINYSYIYIDVNLHWGFDEAINITTWTLLPPG